MSTAFPTTPDPPSRTSSPRPLSSVFRTLKLSRSGSTSKAPPVRSHRSNEDDASQTSDERPRATLKPLSTWLGGSWPSRSKSNRDRKSSAPSFSSADASAVPPEQTHDRDNEATHAKRRLPPPLLPVRTGVSFREPSYPSPASTQSPSSSPLFPRVRDRGLSFDTTATTASPCSPTSRDATSPLGTLHDAQPDLSFVEATLAALDLAVTANAFDAAERKADLPLEIRLRLPFSAPRARRRPASRFNAAAADEVVVPVDAAYTGSSLVLPSLIRARQRTCSHLSDRPQPRPPLRPTPPSPSSFRAPIQLPPSDRPRLRQLSTAFEPRGGSFGTFARPKPRLRRSEGAESRDPDDLDTDEWRAHRRQHAPSSLSGFRHPTLTSIESFQTERLSWQERPSRPKTLSSARLRTMTLLERQRRRSMLDDLRLAEQGKRDLFAPSARPVHRRVLSDLQPRRPGSPVPSFSSVWDAEGTRGISFVLVHGRMSRSGTGQFPGPQKARRRSSSAPGRFGDSHSQATAGVDTGKGKEHPVDPTPVLKKSDTVSPDSPSSGSGGSEGKHARLLVHGHVADPTSTPSDDTDSPSPRALEVEGRKEGSEETEGTDRVIQGVSEALRVGGVREPVETPSVSTPDDESQPISIQPIQAPFRSPPLIRPIPKSPPPRSHPGSRRPISPLGLLSPPRSSSPLRTAPPISARSLSMPTVPTVPSPLSIPKPESLRPPPPPKKRKLASKQSSASESSSSGAEPLVGGPPVRQSVSDWLASTEGKTSGIHEAEVSTPPITTETPVDSPVDPPPVASALKDAIVTSIHEEDPEADESTAAESTTTVDRNAAASNGEPIKPVDADLTSPLGAASPTAERDPTPASQIWLVWASMTSLIVAGCLVLTLEILQLTIASVEPASSRAMSSSEREPAPSIVFGSLPPQGRLVVTADPATSYDEASDSGSTAFWTLLRRMASDWLQLFSRSSRPSQTSSADPPRAAVPPSPRVAITVPPAGSFVGGRFRPLTFEISWSTAEALTEWERLYQRGWDAAVMITAFGLLVGLASFSFSLRRRVIGYMRT